MRHPHLTPRRQAAWALAVMLALSVSLLLATFGKPTPAYACSCAVEPLPAVIGRADAAILGTITEVERPPSWPRFSPSFPFVTLAPDPGAPEVWTVAVDRVWKGQVGATVQVRSDTPATSMCAPYVSSGTSYLIYAMQDGEGLQRQICQRLVEQAQAADDLAQLGPGALPLPGAAAADVRGSPWPFIAVALLLLAALFILAQWRRQRA